MLLLILKECCLNMKGLSYSEIWISEAQERMVLSVPPENMEEIREVFEREDVEATFIGEFTGDKRLFFCFPFLFSGNILSLSSRSHIVSFNMMGFPG